MQRLCVHKSLVRLIAIAFFAETRLAYEKLHGGPFHAVATMAQDLLDDEFLGVLLRHHNGIRSFFVAATHRGGDEQNVRMDRKLCHSWVMLM